MPVQRSRLPRATQLPTDIQQTGDQQTMSIQSTLQRAQDAVNALGGTPGTSDAVTFTAGSQRVINHGLSRVPVEWSSIDVTGGYGSFQRIAWDEKTITIQSANACTAVFRFR